MKEKTVDSKQDLIAMQPDPVTPSPEEVEQYVQALQYAYKGESVDRPWIKREVWNQIRLAKLRENTNRAEAEETLNRIFRLGRPADSIDGFNPGIVPACVGFGRANRFMSGLFRAWEPWLGKKWDRDQQKGTNALDKLQYRPLKAIWRKHRFTAVSDGSVEGFPFNTYVGEGKMDPDRQVLKIDYAPYENNPKPIRRVLDELVEVVPEVYLGKALFKMGNSYRLLLYFANRSPSLGF